MEFVTLVFDANENCQKRRDTHKGRNMYNFLSIEDHHSWFDPSPLPWRDQNYGRNFVRIRKDEKIKTVFRKYLPVRIQVDFIDTIQE